MTGSAVRPSGAEDAELLDVPLICLWNDCGQLFYTQRQLVQHIERHVYQLSCGCDPTRRPEASGRRATWLGSVTVRTLDLRSRGRWFDSRSGRYQVLSTWMGKPSRYITNIKVNSAFHPPGGR